MTILKGTIKNMRMKFLVQGRINFMKQIMNQVILRRVACNKEIQSKAMIFSKRLVGITQSYFWRS